MSWLPISSSALCAQVADLEQEDGKKVSRELVISCYSLEAGFYFRKRSVSFLVGIALRCGTAMSC